MGERLSEAQRHMLTKLARMDSGALPYGALVMDGRSRRPLDKLKAADLVSVEGSWPSGDDPRNVSTVEITDAGRAALEEEDRNG